MNRVSLAAGDLHSWCVPLDIPPGPLAELYATLTADERNRSARLRFERDQDRFVVAHGVLRCVLGRYLDITPREVRFVSNNFGKPELGPEFGGHVRFNLSHAADLALIAIVADADVGVDVEYIRASADYGEIARHCFSAAERSHLTEAPSHRHAEVFLDCWTKKEAYVKARGEGLAIPLPSFSVGQLDDAWSLYTLHPAPGYVGAVAIERGDWQLREWCWRC